MSLPILSLLVVALYVIAAGVLARPMLREGITNRRLGLWIAAAAVIAHAAILVSMHRGGIDLHFFAALSLVGACMAAMCLLVNFAKPVATLGVIVFPLAAALLAVDVFAAPPTAPLQMEWQIKLHVVFALLGYSVLSVAALLAILLAVQEHALRQRQFGRFVSALPPLTLTEALLFQLIGAGFVLLTLTLLSGILFVENLFEQHLIHKTVLSFAAWFVFGALLFGRWRYGWRGRRAIRMTLLGMSLLLLAYFGTRFVLEIVLKRVP
ncbi:MAG: cytochrome c biogenesis protein CcsA [Rudaea sp.]